MVSFYNQFAQAPIGTSFLQAGNSANQLLTGLNLDLKPGKFQQAWEQAFKSYTSNGNNHWHQAYAGFHKLQQDYPDFQAVNPFMDYTSSQSLHEKLPEKSTPNNYLMPLITALIIIGIVILLLAILIWFVWSRRPKPQLAYQTNTQTAPTGTTYPAYPTGYAGYTGNGVQPQPPQVPGFYHQTATPARPMEFAQPQVPQTPQPVPGWQNSQQHSYPVQPSDDHVAIAEPTHSSNEANTQQQAFEGPNNADNPVQAYFPTGESEGDNGIHANNTQVERMEQWPVEIPDQHIGHEDAPTMAAATAAPVTGNEKDLELTNQQAQPEKIEMTQKLPRIRVPSAKITGNLNHQIDSPQPTND
ncbi:hypothetical protein KDW_14060 [Dictyobacter vulcani]|uniref:Uncharacterized protein n=1 Tax=Dictyobacter vulcani TaxID=2607529 RepID=A0A5J4KDR3_9CHLR|nr:hypothetical protein [Dictyobacter vulcani]GER87244.1 hypothetical protein KDW_14060 [Dictyobacter vulcani]